VRPTVLRRFAPVVLLAALAGSACSTTQNNAATVNGQEISAATLTDELKTLRCSETLQAQFVQQAGEKVAGSGEGTFDNNLVSRVLSVRVYFSLLEDRLADQSVTVEDAALDEAREAFRTQVDGELSKTEQKCVTGAYEDWFARQQVLGQLANEQAVVAALEDVEVACVSHILVETEDAAKAIKAELDGGADFATLAKERSTDGSKEQGGDLVQTEFGYHIILVAERRAATPEDVGTEGSQQLLQAYLVDVVCDDDADVSITPSYGRWDRTGCKDGSSFATVVAPEQPAEK
jgi:parvulin-like peptidyl-prolyl isomerase